jgi:hypothetical protein
MTRSERSARRSIELNFCVQFDVTTLANSLCVNIGGAGEGARRAAACVPGSFPGVRDPIPPFGVSLATNLTRYMIFALVNQL